MLWAGAGRRWPAALTRSNCRCASRASTSARRAAGAGDSCLTISRQCPAWPDPAFRRWARSAQVPLLGPLQGVRRDPRRTGKGQVPASGSTCSSMGCWRNSSPRICTARRLGFGAGARAKETLSRRLPPPLPPFQGAAARRSIPSFMVPPQISSTIADTISRSPAGSGPGRVCGSRRPFLLVAALISGPPRPGALLLGIVHSRASRLFLRCPSISLPHRVPAHRPFGFRNRRA